MVTGTQKDHRHEAHIHTQSRPSRSIMNSLCSNLQFYHQMVWNGQVNVWLLGVMTHLLPSRKRWDGIQCRGTLTENNPTTLDCARVLSKSRGNQNTEVGGRTPSHKNEAEPRSKMHRRGFSWATHTCRTNNQPVEVSHYGRLQRDRLYRNVSRLPHQELSVRFWGMWFLQ